jgi:hypothetical protein
MPLHCQGRPASGQTSPAFSLAPPEQTNQPGWGTPNMGFRGIRLLAKAKQVFRTLRLIVHL